MTTDDWTFVRHVIDVMVEHNHPQRDDDMPYPQSLRGMAEAVIAAVREHDAGADEAAHQEVEAEMAAESEAADEAWEMNR